MYNQPFLIPRYITPKIIARNAILTPKNTNLLKNITSTIKKINWTNIINNTSKTLGIVNQTIPLVKQIGPIYTNVKSMMKIASVFKDETDTNSLNNNVIINNKQEKAFITNDESPTFFLNN